MTARLRSFLALFKSSRLPCFFAQDFNLTHQHTASDHTKPYNIHSHRATPTMYADCLPGASVKVRVNGMPLTEHATENGDLSATTFVEAIAGANFAVILHLEDTFTYRQPADRIKFEVFLDGERAGALVVDPASILHATAVIDYIYETSGGRTTRRKFLFAELETCMPTKRPWNRVMFAC